MTLDILLNYNNLINYLLENELILWCLIAIFYIVGAVLLYKALFFNSGDKKEEKVVEEVVASPTKEEIVQEITPKIEEPTTKIEEPVNEPISQVNVQTDELELATKIVSTVQSEKEQSIGIPKELGGDIDLTTEKVTKERVVTTKSFNDRGLDAYKQGELAEALVCFEVALEDEPKNPDILNNIGVVYYDYARIAKDSEHEKLNDDVAITYFDKALKINSFNPEYYFNRGRVAYYHGGESEADKFFNVINKEPVYEKKIREFKEYFNA